MVLDAPDEESMGFIFLSAKHTDPVGNNPTGENRRGFQGTPPALNQLVMQLWVRWERVRSPVVWLAV
jgi:hypothetical protein